jgi:membrane protein implicated in regulation of membrane protease activity
MKMKTEELPLDDATRMNASCPTGGCGGPGLCPGIALLLAYLVGGGVTWLPGLEWLGWVVGLPLALILITGAWRFLPARKVSRTLASDASNSKR